MDNEALDLFTLVAEGSGRFTSRGRAFTDDELRRAIDDLGAAVFPNHPASQAIDPPSTRDEAEAKSPLRIGRVAAGQSLAAQAIGMSRLEAAAGGVRRLAELLVSPGSDAFRPRLLDLALLQPIMRSSEGDSPIIDLYAPLYLSNVCTNRCTYCGFRHDNDIPRLTLSPPEIDRECRVLSSLGLEEVLLLTGEAPAQVGVDYVVGAIEIAKRYFSRVGLEVFPMSTDDYRRARAAGAEALTLYQETYDPRIYRAVHEAGRKRNYQHRLGGPHRAADAGFELTGIGALLGLADWRFETVALVLHARFLRALHPNLGLSVSFPRLRTAHGAYPVRSPVSDDALFHMMSVIRILVPEATLVLSTRESPAFRDDVVGRLVTKLSAGSKTQPGGYATGGADAGAQFEVHDHRSPEEISVMLRGKGLRTRGFRPSAACPENRLIVVGSPF